MNRPITEVLSVERVREAAKAFPEVRVLAGSWVTYDEDAGGDWCACPASIVAHQIGVRLEDIAADAIKPAMVSQALGVDEEELLAFTAGVDGRSDPYTADDFYGPAHALEAARLHGQTVRAALGLGGTK